MRCFEVAAMLISDRSKQIKAWAFPPAGAVSLQQIRSEFARLIRAEAFAIKVFERDRRQAKMIVERLLLTDLALDQRAGGVDPATGERVQDKHCQRDQRRR